MSGPTSTRERIQQVALELFSEQGYDQTSLREIAERLGVTKAALYYHFKSKDEIATSFLEDRLAKLDELLDWLKSAPPGAATRRDFLRRYADELHGPSQTTLVRFFERNQPALQNLEIGQRMRQRVRQIVDLLAGPEADPADRIRIGLALFAFHSAWFAYGAPEVTDEELRRASVAVALELVDRIGT